MIQTTTAREFRAEMHRKHSDEFALHRAAAELLEVAIATPRSMPSVVHVGLDMLMVQGYKSHYAVRLTVENGNAEDAAVLTRRIMELGVQAAYIGAHSDAQVCASRAGRYLSHLWRAAPPELKQHLPEAATGRWTRIDEKYGSTLPKRHWGPSFQQMFTEIGRADTYEQDYRYLSSISHGSTEEAILHYSLPTVPVRSDRYVPVLLTFATRYYLALAHVWENWFRVVDQDRYLRTVQPLLEHTDQKCKSAPAG